MKKLIIIAIMSVFGGMFNSLQSAVAVAYEPETPQKEPSSVPISDSHINLIKEHIKLTEEIYNSITSSQNTTLSFDNYQAYFLKRPKDIYDVSRQNANGAYSLFRKVKREETIAERDMHLLRESIKKRIQSTAIMDKAIALRAFLEADRRFTHLVDWFHTINTINDIKNMLRIQASAQVMLAMIQNEAIKMQMVAHSRNAEQELINQKKDKRNMKILSSLNKEMPRIKSSL